jgi:hypothetical protein
MVTKRLSKITANGLSIGPANTTTANAVTHNDLGLAIYDSNTFTSANGWITLQANSASWGPSLNLVSTSASNTTISGNVVFTQTLEVNTKGTTANSALRLTDIASLGSDFLITTIGSLDLQFTTVNANAGSVDASGVPAYISSFSNPQHSNPLLSGIGTSNQTVAPYILGNASSLGTDYTVINTQYNSVRGDPNPTGYSHVSGTVTMVIDLALASGLSNDQYLPGTSTVNPSWKGNYKFDAFSSLFKIKEYNFWDYINAQDTFEYSVNMVPQSLDYTNSNYGKYNVSAVLWAAQAYHSANLGARWMGIATKVRNIIQV